MKKKFEVSERTWKFLIDEERKKIAQEEYKMEKKFKIKEMRFQESERNSKTQIKERIEQIAGEEKQMKKKFEESKRRMK